MITREQFKTLAAVEASGEAIVANSTEIERAGAEYHQVMRMAGLGLIELATLGTMDVVKVTTLGRAEMINWLVKRQ